MNVYQDLRDSIVRKLSNVYTINEVWVELDRYNGEYTLNFLINYYSYVMSAFVWYICIGMCLFV